MQLKAGALIEHGDFRFNVAFPVVVRVVDISGKPVEGVPLRQKYLSTNSTSVAHNTDMEGRAYFHINPKSKGEFRLHDLPCSQEARQAANLGVSFEADDKPPPKLLEIVILDEQLQLLRGGK